MCTHVSVIDSHFMLKREGLVYFAASYAQQQKIHLVRNGLREMAATAVRVPMLLFAVDPRIG